MEAKRGRGLKAQSFTSGEDFLVRAKKKGKERARKEARKAGKEPLLEKPPNNLARRKARKAEREKAVAQASEDLKRSALLSRRRKRSAMRILKLKELEEEQKVVIKAKKRFEERGQHHVKEPDSGGKETNRARRGTQEDQAH